MKKPRNKKPGKTAKRKAQSQSAASPGPAAPSQSAKGKPIDRRAMLGRLRHGGIAAAVILGGGYLSISSVRARMAETDLSRVGQGTPTIVQIHDPQCSICRRLQSETRSAVSNFAEDDITYLVADLNSKKGRDFANKHLVGKTTLLLFDGAGELKHTIRGVQSDGLLQSEFTHYLGVEAEG